jgi:DNA-binding GntR family transcriptional regulator
MTDASRASKQEQVYGILRSRILNGAYPPGYRLVIDTIRRELRVSPMPVREAIRRLEAERWVVYRPHSGAQVAHRDEKAWEEVIEALAVLEGYVTASAAPHLRPEDLARLRELSETMQRDIRATDVVALNRHNEEWHRAIWDRCPNRLLRQEVDTMQERLNVYRDSLYVPIAARAQAAIDEHAELLSMLESSAPASAIEGFARAHKLRMMDTWKNARSD